jgi:hypothetical protein
MVGFAFQAFKLQASSLPASLPSLSGFTIPGLFGVLNGKELVKGGFWEAAFFRAFSLWDSFESGHGMKGDLLGIRPF